MRKKSKMMAERLSTKTLQIDQVSQRIKNPPQNGSPHSAAIHSHLQSTAGRKMTMALWVRLPSQKRVRIHVEDGNLESAAKLKQIICQQIGLPATEKHTVVLTHLGKTLSSNIDSLLSQDATEHPLTTIQVSMVLPGGSMSAREVKSQLRDGMAAESWSGLADADKIETLQKLNTESQVELWAQIGVDDKAKFIMDFLSDVVEKNKFWFKMTHQMQVQALNLLSLEQLVDLLGSLNQENLCLTISIHQDLVREGKSLLDLLQDDDKRLAVQTFMKCGKSSVTDGSGSQLVEKLLDQQYDGYSSIQNLRPNYDYIQTMLNPRIKNGFITLADVQNEVKLYVSNSETSNSDNQAAQDNDLPRFLTTKFVEEGDKHYKKWIVKQENPASVLNENKKSVISSFEQMPHESDFENWCSETFTIANRMSKLYLGQDDDIFIFARDRTVPEQEKELKEHEEGEQEQEEHKFEEEEEEQKDIVDEEPNHIQLHLFSFVVRDFDETGDMEILRNMECVIKKSEKTIDADLIAKLTKEISDKYNQFQEEASKDEKKKAISHCQEELRNHQNQRFNYAQWISSKEGTLVSRFKAADKNGDKLLNKQEFKDFFDDDKGLIRQFCGNYVDSQDFSNKFYDLLSQLTPEVDGISNVIIQMFFMKIWFPTWCRLLIENNSKGSSHQTFQIKEDSHLGLELLKEKQEEKKGENQYQMDQAPNMIKIQGKLFLSYTSATKELGASLYFYDLENGRTCARISKAELLVDSYPHQTKDSVTLIRYIIEKQIFERSVDFKRFQTMTPEIYDIAQDDQTLIAQSPLERGKDSSGDDNWANRYGNQGKDFRVFVYVNKYEEKPNFEKSFQMIFTKIEKPSHDTQNWGLCFQSYVDGTGEIEGEQESEQAPAQDKKVIFRETLSIEGAEQIVIQKDEKDEKNSKTFVLSQYHRTDDPNKNSRHIVLHESKFDEKDLKSFKSIYCNHEKDKGSYRLNFDCKSKCIPSIIAADEKFKGFFVQKDDYNNLQANTLLQFHLQQENFIVSKEEINKQENKKEVPKFKKQFVQEKKLWNNTVISYPLMFYTGLTHACREIVVVNLADNKQPQRIIQLPEGQQLANLNRSNLDDRIYFTAFVAHSPQELHYEILVKFPFRKSEDYDHHNDISIRRVLYIQHHTNNPFIHHVNMVLSRDVISDPLNPKNKLTEVWMEGRNGCYQEIDVAGKRQMKAEDSKILKEIQRSGKNNFFWLEQSLSQGILLAGVFNIINKDLKIDDKMHQNEDEETHESTVMNKYRMGDTECLSIIAESKLVGEKQQEVISVLDKDLNLRVFTVNFEEKSFVPLPVRNLQDELKIDTEWLKFNEKPQLDFESYKQRYQLFSSETVGVVPNNDNEGFIVFYNLNSQAFSMVNSTHKKYPVPNRDSREKLVVTWTKNCEGSDFRLMECLNNKTFQSHFVVYPAPESRKLDLFGLYGRRNNVSTHFISENIFLAQFHYKDVFQNWIGEGRVEEEEFYWSVIDQTGQIKSLSQEIDKNSLVVFSKQTEQGSTIILNKDSTILEQPIYPTKENKELTRNKIYKQLREPGAFQNPRERQEGNTFATQLNLIAGLQKWHKIAKRRMIYKKPAITKKSQAISQKSSKYQMIQLDLKGDLVYQHSFDDQDIKSICWDMMQEEMNHELLHKYNSNPNDDKWTISKVFCLPEKGELYRFVGIPRIEMQEDQIEFESPKIHAAMKFALIDEGQRDTKVDLTLIFFFIDSQIAYEDFHKTVLHVSKDQLFFYSNELHYQAIKIYPLNEMQGSFTQTKTFEKKAIIFGKGDANSMQKEQDKQRRAETLGILNKIEESSCKLGTNNSKESNTLQKFRRDSKPQFWSNTEVKVPKEIVIEKSRNLYPKNIDFGLQLNSLESTIKKLHFKVHENQIHAGEHNYLQVSLPDRVILYDLSFEDPKESYSCFKINFFVNPRNFVDLDLPKIWSKQKQEKETSTWRQVTACHQRNLFLQKDIVNQFEENQEKFVSLIKNYSFSDVQGLDWLSEKLNKEIGLKESYLLESTIVSYQGHSIFSIFSDQEAKLKQIIQFIGEDLMKRQETQKVMYKSFKRRIQKILSMPVPEFAVNSSKSKTTQSASEKPQEESSSRDKKNQDDKVPANEQEKSIWDINEVESCFKSALERCIDFDVVIRDLFIILAEENTEYILSDLTDEQSNLDTILKNYSTPLNDFLTSQVVLTPFTKKITKITWPKGSQKYVTFSQSTQEIDQNQVQELVSESLGTSKDTFAAAVTVKMLRTKWLLQKGQNFAQFSNVLQNCSSESIYDTEFMKVLVKGYWPQTSSIVIKRCFLPWLLYLLCTIFLFARILGPEDADMDDSITDEQDGQTMKYILSGSNILLIAYQVYQELIQVQSTDYDDLKEHFSSPYNILDILQLSSTLWITIANLPEGGSAIKETHRVIAAISIFIIWFKLFDWLRLFEETAFYLKLVFKTLSDIGTFTILFIVGLAMFGSAMLMIQNNDKDTELIGSHFNHWFVDLVLNQYLLSLGEFNNDYADHPQWQLCWILLISATFFTQITMLNMLVAIMGNTFDNVIEKRAIYIMKSQLQTMSEYSDIINKYERDSKTFLFIVKINADEEDGMDDNGSWEGGFSYLRKSMFKKMDKLEVGINEIQIQQVSKLTDQIKSVDIKTKEENRDSKIQIDGMHSKLTKWMEQSKVLLEDLDVVEVELNERADQAILAAQIFTGKVPRNLRPMDECLEEIVTRRVAWFEQLSLVDQGKVDADNALPEAVIKAEFEMIWSLSDTDQDGLLQRDEMPILFQTYEDSKTRKDVPNEPQTDEQKEVWYDFFEGQTPDVDGVSKQDYEEGHKIFVSKFIAKRFEMKQEE